MPRRLRARRSQLFIAATQACFGAFVTVHLVRNHWPAQDIGFALTASTVASLLGQIPAGALIDAMRDKRMAVLTGVSGVGAAALLLAFSPTRPSVYLAQALQGPLVARASPDWAGGGGR